MAYSLAVKLTVLCSGTDAAGKAFEERTRTTLIERNGGRLLTQQKLKPGAELQLCLLARPDRPAKVAMGEALHSGNEGFEWSFQFVQATADFWGVRFPNEEIEEAASAPAAGPVAEAASAGTTLAQMSEQLVLLSAHADDHLRYCTQEMEVLQQRFTRELETALDSSARQLRQLARSTMETTFRSLLEDLARRAAETVDENLKRMRQSVNEAIDHQRKSLNEEAEAHLEKFQDRLEKHSRQLSTHLEHLQAQSERAMQEAIQQAIAEFQAGCAGVLKEMLHTAEAHRPPRAAARKK